MVANAAPAHPQPATRMKNRSRKIFRTAENARNRKGVRLSPTARRMLVVKDQKAVAEVVWSSPNYDYMKVGEEKFLPVNQGGEASVFEIPVTVFDRKMAVAADTTAMSTPHEIEYTLLFDSASIKTE